MLIKFSIWYMKAFHYPWYSFDIFFYKGRVFCTLITKVLLFSLFKKCFHKMLYNVVKKNPSNKDFRLSTRREFQIIYNKGPGNILFCLAWLINWVVFLFKKKIIENWGKVHWNIFSWHLCIPIVGQIESWNEYLNILRGEEDFLALIFSKIGDNDWVSETTIKYH